MHRLFKFHEFTANVEDGLLGKDICAVTLFVEFPDGKSTKAHMSSIPRHMRPKSQEEEEEITMTAMIQHYLSVGWEIFEQASPKNRVFMQDAFAVLAKAIETGKMELPKYDSERGNPTDIINRVLSMMGQHE